MFRPVGMLSITSRVMTVRAVMFCTSTSGDSAATVIVSSIAPTFISALIVAVKSDVSSTPSRFTVLKPGRANETEYVPVRRLVIEYRPAPSVVAARVCSMSAGLETSTVTPGSTAPDVSLTSPAMPLVCADAVSGRSSASAATAHICLASFRMLETSSKIDTGRKYARMTVQYPCLPLQSLSGLNRSNVGDCGEILQKTEWNDHGT